MTISTGVGLMSGLDIQSIVEQLMAIESQPLTLAQARIAETQQQQTAYMSVSATLSAVQSAISALTQPSAFTSKTVTSSDEQVLTASTTGSASLGSTSLMVRSLVSTHKLVSSGFSDRQSSVGAGVLIFESAESTVAPSTSLNLLNGGEGVRRGTIRITDGNGGTADVDLTTATTIDDVMEAINSQYSADVRASVSDNHLVIEDLSGAATSTLRIVDLAGGYAAADLGIAQTSDSGTIVGRDVLYLAESTRLSKLNDGNGVRFDSVNSDFLINLADGSQLTVNLTSRPTFETRLAQLNGGDGVRLGTIRITNRDGQQAEIDLTGAQTIQDVKDRIDEADIGVSISGISGSKLLISDSTGGETSNLIIEDVTGYAAADLGIVADTDENTVSGAEIYSMDTLGDVMRAIQYAPGNEGRVSVAISGNGLSLIDNTTGMFETEIVSANESMALYDLGFDAAFAAGGQLQTRDLIAGLNTVLLSSLKGGTGLQVGTLDFTLRDGTTVSGLDFSGAQTLSDIINVINSHEKLAAEVDAGGTRIRITDQSGGTGTLSATGSMAEELGLVSNGSGSELLSDDLQKRYVNENTLLADLNQGNGIEYGQLKITNAAGLTKTLTLLEGQHQTVGDVIQAINDLEMDVTAGINANGDGIELVDLSTGDGTLTVAEDGSTTAASLGLVGQAEDGVLAGSFAVRIEIGASDTLDDLVTKINQSGANVTASLINDGSGDNPYRLVLASKVTGKQGEIAYSSDVPGLSLDTLSKASDATVVLGDPGSPNAVVITSSSNTLTDIVPGMTLELHGVSDQPVTITVDRDVETVVTNVTTFVDAFNTAMEQIDELTRYNAETEQKGILLGDNTIRQIQSQLFNAVTAAVGGEDTTYKRLSQLGIMVDSSSGSARLTMNRTMTDGTNVDGEARLREALLEDPEGVQELFTRMDISEDNEPVSVGLALLIEDALESITTSAGGLLALQNDRLESQVSQFEDRAEQLQILLDKKEARLYAQFQAMESALAGMQSQQSSLASLASMASTS